MQLIKHISGKYPVIRETTTKCSFQFPYLLLIVPVLLLTCKKGNNPGGIPPPIPDSLYSWKEVLHLNNLSINDINFISYSKGFFACSDGYIYQSADSGRNWSKIPGTETEDPINFFFLNGQYGFLQGANQIQITRDGGKSWTLKPLPSTFATGVFFVSPSTGYFGDPDSGLYKTVDTCNSWTIVYRAAQGPQGYYPFFLNSDTGYVFSGDGMLSQTRDASLSWQSLVTNVAVNYQGRVVWNTLYFSDSLCGYYGCGAGVLKTTDGGVSWNLVEGSGGSINIVRFPAIDTGYYLSDAAIYKTTDAGRSWVPSCKLGSSSFEGMNFMNGSTGWACTNAGYIYRLTQ